jgi:hypothetical protein
MNAHDNERIRKQLQQFLPPMGDTGPERDLWPAMLQQLESKRGTNPIEPVPSVWAWGSAWFDGALLAGLVALVAIFPSAIPVLLYYL